MVIVLLVFLPVFVHIYYICMLEAILAALVTYGHGGILNAKYKSLCNFTVI